METIYFKTSSFIRHDGNVVDLGTYRQKLAAVSGDSWCGECDSDVDLNQRWAPVPSLYVMEPASRPAPTVPQKDQRRGHQVTRWLDMGASVTVIALTLTALVQFVRLF